MNVGVAPYIFIFRNVKTRYIYIYIYIIKCILIYAFIDNAFINIFFKIIITDQFINITVFDQMLTFYNLN